MSKVFMFLFSVMYMINKIHRISKISTLCTIHEIHDIFCRKIMILDYHLDNIISQTINFNMTLY